MDIKLKESYYSKNREKRIEYATNYQRNRLRHDASYRLHVKNYMHQYYMTVRKSKNVQKAVLTPNSHTISL